MDTHFYCQTTDFLQTINSRVNRLTKLAPNNVTRKHVPAKVSINANNPTKVIQKPKFYVGVYVRIAKTDSPFRKGYKLIFTDAVFEIVAIPTVLSATYRLIFIKSVEHILTERLIKEIKTKFKDKFYFDATDFDENGDYHIGYKKIPSFDVSYEGNELYESQFPYDLTSGTSHVFVNFDILQYQNVGDAKAPLIRVIDSIRRIKNGCCLQH